MDEQPGSPYVVGLGAGFREMAQGEMAFGFAEAVVCDFLENLAGGGLQGGGRESNADGLQAGAEAIVDAASHLEQLRRQPFRLFYLFKGFAGIRQAVAEPVEFVAHLVVILARQPNILNRMLECFVIFDFA